MQLTEGAVSMLVDGAYSESQDLDTLSPSSKEFYSGLVQCEDDKDLRKFMDLDEFSPILQVQEITWLGTWCQFPTMQPVVTDGKDSITMMAGHHLPSIWKSLFRKFAPFYSGKLNIGKRFKLIDYTTGLSPRKVGTMPEPTIFLELLRAEPKTLSQKAICNFLSRSAPTFGNLQLGSP
jgi:hypothetical protein